MKVVDFKVADVCQYAAPDVQVIGIDVERGFAQSYEFEENPDGDLEGGGEI